MKKIAFLILIYCMWSCSSNNHVLTEAIPVDILVDTIFNKLTNGNDGIYAKMTSPNQIQGFGGGYGFTIDDQKNTYSFYQGTIIGKVLYNNFQQILVMDGYGSVNGFGYGGTPKNLSIKKSVNAGSYYDTQYSQASSNNTNTFTNAYFTSIDTGWVFSYYGNPSSSFPDTGSRINGIRVYKAEGVNFSLIDYIDKYYYPLNAHFENANKGKLLATYWNVYTDAPLFVFRTEDGGKSWNGPFPVSAKSGDSYSEIRFMNTGKYIIFSGDSLFVSMDDCNTFQKTRMNGFIKDIFVVNENLVYMALLNSNNSNSTQGNIYKSVDLGKSWQMVSQNPLYVNKIHFYDYLNGVATLGSTVQVTHDGGQTWKLLIYPLHLKK